MYAVFSVASLVLLCLSIYTLARANGWARWQSAFASFGFIFGGIAGLTVVLTRPILSPFVQERVAGLMLTAVMVLLFALSKSVSQKVSDQHPNEPR